MMDWMRRKGLNRYATLAKEWAYEIQWMTPIEIAQNGSSQVVCEVHICKVLQTSATEMVCKVDCWNVGTELAWQVYHLVRRTHQVYHDCSSTLTLREE
jgi:hypothetical protein